MLQLHFTNDQVSFTKAIPSCEYYYCVSIQYLNNPLSLIVNQDGEPSSQILKERGRQRDSNVHFDLIKIYKL